MLNLLEQSPKPQVLYLSYQCNKLWKLGPLWPRYSFSRGLPSSSSRNILGSCGKITVKPSFNNLTELDHHASKSNDTEGCVSKLMALKSIGFLLKVGISTRYHGVPNFETGSDIFWIYRSWKSTVFIAEHLRGRCYVPPPMVPLIPLPAPAWQSLGSSTDQYMILPVFFLGFLPPFRPLALGVALDVGNKGSWQCAAVGRASHYDRHRHRPTHAPGDGHKGDILLDFRCPKNWNVALDFDLWFIWSRTSHTLCTSGNLSI